MNVYDFDNTIYDGESVFDFYLYSVRKQPELIRYFFVVVKTLIKYKLCIISEDEFSTVAGKYAKSYIKSLKDIKYYIKDFWDKNLKKIKPFFLNNMESDDIIISASVDFLLEELFLRIGVKNYIATKIDITTGEIKEICFRKNKEKLFRKYFPDAEIENFYTDSKNDEALMKLAKNAYMVKGENIKQVKPM